MPQNIDLKALFAGISPAWRKILLHPTLDEALLKLQNEDGQITPPVGQIFNFARYTDPNKLLAGLMGQDPYPKKDEACGLAFSSNGMNIPPSLRNIFGCLVRQGIMAHSPKKPDLSGWAEQGVLLLNASLTTIVGKTNAHKHIWAPYVDAIIAQLRIPVFMLWGNDAKSKRHLIHADTHVLQWIHPSPLAQNKASEDSKFYNCTNFNEANHILTVRGLPKIDWARTAGVMKLAPAPEMPEIKEEEPAAANIIAYVVYTDGACPNNGKAGLAVAGYAAVFTEGPLAGMVAYGRAPPRDGNVSTNIRGEGYAIISALMKCQEHAKSKESAPKIEIVTDSQFWIDMITKFMPSWEAKGASFHDKKNADLTVPMWNMIKNIGTKNVTMTFVASHDKDPSTPPEMAKFNAIADKYAVMGVDIAARWEMADIISPSAAPAAPPS